MKLQILAITAVLGLLAWCVAEFRGGRTFRICVGVITLAAVGWAAYLAGGIVERMHWAVDVKHEQNFMEMGMLDIEQRLSSGETQAVLNAVHAYNQTLLSATNSERHLQAASNLLDHLK